METIYADKGLTTRGFSEARRDIDALERKLKSFEKINKDIKEVYLSDLDEIKRAHASEVKKLQKKIESLAEKQKEASKRHQ